MDDAARPLPAPRPRGGGGVPRYEADHNRLFLRVAGPGVLLTLASGALLLFSRPPEVPLAAAVMGLALFAAIVASTVVFQAPQHAKLARGFDEEVYRFLLGTNWLRTAA